MTADDKTEDFLGVDGDSGLLTGASLAGDWPIRVGGVFCVEAGRAGAANLMQGRRGASWADGVLTMGVGRAFVGSWIMGFAAQANWMQRLRGASLGASCSLMPDVVPLLSEI